MAQVSCTMYSFPHNHPLTRYNDGADYVCGGCRLPGDRRTARHGCSTCNFNLHDSCAACPNTLSTFMHHRHQLTLIVRKGEGTRLCCDLCGGPVEGIYYGCTFCEFYLHPICSQLPERVGLTLHRDHPLRLQNIVGTPSCLVCMETCRSWHYRCDSNCTVGIHIGCIVSANQTAKIESASRSLGPWHTYGCNYPATAPSGPYYPTYGGGYASPANLPPQPPSPYLPWNGAGHIFPQLGVYPPPPPPLLPQPHPQYGAYYPPHCYNFQAVAGGPNPQPQPQPHVVPHPYHYGVPPQGHMNLYGTHYNEGGQAVPAQGGGWNKIGAMMSSIVGSLTLQVGCNLISEWL